MTLMVSNLLLQYEVDFDHVKRTVIDEIEQNILKEVENLLSICKQHGKELIIVSNEVGLGVVPAYRLGNIFRDIAGRINQRLAKEADEVFFLASGLPLKLK
ncbi:MAG: bifunctional adenosylcobinamide kinase/adenosylcobinamide-phosphate guanylyltransferase, partial [Zhenhengia sp.]